MGFSLTRREEKCAPVTEKYNLTPYYTFSTRSRLQVSFFLNLPLKYAHHFLLLCNHSLLILIIQQHSVTHLHKTAKT